MFNFNYFILKKRENLRKRDNMSQMTNAKPEDFFFISYLFRRAY